jgi:glycosyltransferase involved in cell wall biosynthesis
MSPQNEKEVKKVLMIARAFPPFLPVGHSIRVIKFIKYLPALGWNPVVLTVDDKKEYETLPKVGSKTLLSEIQPNLKIHRINPGEPSLEYLQKELEFSRKNRLTKLMVALIGGARRWAFRNLFLPDRYLTWLPFAVRRGRQMIKSEGIDAIFTTCPPHSAILIGACLKLLTGKPLVLDFRDDWIDTPWFQSKPKLIQMVERQLENWAIKTADKVILVTKWSQKAFQERYPRQPGEKFIHIPNGCDLDEFTFLNSSLPSAKNSKFTILHAGSLNVSTSWGRSPTGLFQALHNLLQQKPDLAEKLTLVFAGDLPEEHRQLAEELGLSSVIQGLGHVPHTEVLRLIQSADLLLAMNYEGWSTLIPGKIYEYWAVGGAPILLLSCPGAAADFIEEHQLGFTVDPYAVNEIEAVILKVYTQSQTDSPLRITNAGVETYDRQSLTRQLSQVLAQVSRVEHEQTNQPGSGPETRSDMGDTNSNNSKSLRRD